MKAALLLLACATLPAQTFLEGHVVNAVTALPVAGAYVRFFSNSTGDTAQVSDAAGFFRLAVPSQRNQLIAVRCAGYLIHSQGVRANQGASPADLRVPLTPAAVLTGTVEDQDGLPVVQAMVETLFYTSDNGARILAKSQPAYTNDNGEYRIPGLSAGHIYLRVTPDKLAQWDSRYGARLYPSTTDFSRAEAIEIKAGEQHNLPAVRLMRVEGVSVSGVAELPAQARGGVYLHSTGPLAFQASALVRPDGGNFIIAHVPPGSYILDNLAPFARAGHRTAPRANGDRGGGRRRERRGTDCQAAPIHRSARKAHVPRQFQAGIGASPAAGRLSGRWQGHCRCGRHVCGEGTHSRPLSHFRVDAERPQIAVLGW